LITIHRK
jgi:hypothetical protein